jgi:hypothetical protein
MRTGRRGRPAILLLALLVLGAVLAQLAAGSGPTGGPPLASDDAGPTGALALSLWIARLGYPVRRLSGTRATPDDGVRVLFVLDPTRRFTRAESTALLDWVRRGGTLVYFPGIVPSFRDAAFAPDDGLGADLGASLRLPPLADGSGSPVRSLPPAFPAFFAAPAPTRFDVRVVGGLDLRGESWAPLAVDASAAPARTIAATEALGRGRVVAAASASFFANGEIGAADNAALVLNALARVPTGATVDFDEYHHGDVAAPDLVHAMRDAPWGWAIGYAALLTFLFALWGGRRFGPPLVPDAAPGRSAADYVTSFAGLLQRRGGKDAIGWAQRRYASQVRRRLARARGLRPDLPAADLARLVAERRPIDPAALAAHLIALDGPPLGERALLRRMRELETMMRELR